jgi:hypothetical protein
MEIKLNNKNYRIQNISSKKYFEILSKEKVAYLIDVRTHAEWQFVGVPDLSPIKKEVIFVSWQIHPEMNEHENFYAGL